MKATSAAGMSHAFSRGRKNESELHVLHILHSPSWQKRNGGQAVNSRAKGKRGERAWRDELREAGWTSARRGQQFAGSPDSPDVICQELNVFHFEVKYCERPKPRAFLAQASQDAGAAKVPVVAWRGNGEPFTVLMRAADFIALVKCADLAAFEAGRRDNGTNPASPCAS